jgi:glycosyltransferase involved in cell wall biosynthesis
MKRRTKLSLAMIVRNEEKNLEEALTLVKDWADEIVIVDDGSTDRTIEVAKRFTDKIFSRRMELEGKQRNFAVEKASNDWVIFQDGDERLTPEVMAEIDGLLDNHDGEKFSYWIPRKNYLGDHWLRYGGWYPAAHIKLYHRKYLRWKEDPSDVVHPGIEYLQDKYGAALKNHMIHYNFRNIEDFIGKVNNQTTLEAIKWHLQNRKVSMSHGYWKAFDRFFKRFVLKKGYKDGHYGFVAAALSGFYQWAAYCKFRELKDKGMYLERIKK